ncbi:MAG: NAD(P)/FAD-dependent oxidoreductase [Alphaproteobacteria bacterium]
MPRTSHVDSYFAATANDHPEYPELNGEVRADVCVIGGGYTGLSTAICLAERGYDVVVLEANRVGWGASGRNGGQICTGFAPGMGAVQKALGKADAKKIFDITEEAKALLRERVARYKIDCDLHWGYFHAATKQRHVVDLAEDQETLARDFGYDDTRLVKGRDAVAPYVNSKAYVGGLYEGGAGHLHPLNYCLGLARAAEAAGARIFEGSAVERLEHGTPAMAVCATGSVTAKTVVLAGNAYLGGVVPEIQGKVMPVGTYIAATEVLGESRARSLIPKNIGVADCNFVLNYYKRSTDHRMLFGGRVSYSTLMPPNLPKAMRHKMLEVFPDLSDVRFEYTWGGFVAITMERTPHFGRLGDNIYFAQGYSGQGAAMTGIAGKILAEAIAGQAERFDLLARLPHTTFPGGRLFRTPTLAMAMLWYRMRDLL